MSDYSMKKMDAEWRAAFDPMQDSVARQAATERPFSSKYWGERFCINSAAIHFAPK